MDTERRSHAPLQKYISTKVNPTIHFESNSKVIEAAPIIDSYQKYGQ